MSKYECAIRGGTVVLDGRGPVRCDLGITSGRIAGIELEIDSVDTEESINAQGMLVVPGAVDSHYHLGIYRDLTDDAKTETESSVVGGVTTVLSYFRTGSHYLNKTGTYHELLPEVLEKLNGNIHTDFALHLAPMTREHVDEIPWLVHEQGITSFKYYMFYKGLNLAASSTDASAYTMTDEYDLGHLYSMMEKIAEVAQTSPGRVSLSVHCESSELIKLFIERVKDLGLPPLEAYSRARPPLSERLSIHEAGVLADSSGANVNFLHLSSEEALRASRQVRTLYPHVDLRLETTVHHLCLTYDALEGQGLGGKVNPPLRTRLDVEALWAGVSAGDINWIASDHACCLEELKGDDLWPALPGFGGTALLYPVMVSEGFHKRNLPLSRIVELVSTNPAKAFSLYPRKGSLLVGADADLALIDLDLEQTVTPALLHSAQDHTPFEGVRVKGWPTLTMLRGSVVFREDDLVAPRTGAFIQRPVDTRSELLSR